jgi:hypothetical protein
MGPNPTNRNAKNPGQFVGFKQTVFGRISHCPTFLLSNLDRVGQNVSQADKVCPKVKKSKILL